MKQGVYLTIIGFIGGIVLMGVLWIVLSLTGNAAYHLLFNFDYVPVINELRPVWLYGYIFHFLTCVISVLSLYFILKRGKLHRQILPYIIVYTIGGAALFFLTALSERPPAKDDVWAWAYWTLGHAIFGYVIGILIKGWK